MVKRTITVIIGLPILIALIISGGLWLRIGLLVLSCVGLYEFYRALSGKIQLIHYVGYFFSVVYFIFIMDAAGRSGAAGQSGTAAIHGYLLIILSAFILATLAMTVIFYNKVDIRDCLVTICGFFYVPFLLSFIYFVRDSSIYFVWLIFTSASASDTFAYFVGRKWGRHKLIGTPSPSKSVEGCIGGIIGAALVGFLYGQIAVNFIEIDYSAAGHIVLGAVVVSVVGAVFSQFGDLFASAVKRSAGIKDFGKVLPGHGGMLDRFDGILVAAPVVYMVMTLIWI